MRQKRGTKPAGVVRNASRRPVRCWMVGWPATHGGSAAQHRTDATELLPLGTALPAASPVPTRCRRRFRTKDQRADPPRVPTRVEPSPRAAYDAADFTRRRRRRIVASSNGWLTPAARHGRRLPPHRAPRHKPRRPVDLWSWPASFHIPHKTGSLSADVRRSEGHWAGVAVGGQQTAPLG